MTQIAAAKNKAAAKKKTAAAKKKTAAKKKAAAKKKTAAKKKPAAKKKTAAKKKAATSGNSQPPSTVSINPLRDLGISKGYVCFRIKAYSNIEVSDFSKPVCGYIKNSKSFKLAWTPSSKSVIGYHVYSGTSAKITENFITDVM